MIFRYILHLKKHVLFTLVYHSLTWYKRKWYFNPLFRTWLVIFFPLKKNNNKIKLPDWSKVLYYVLTKHRTQDRIFVHIKMNHISNVMVSVLASSAVDHGFEPESGQIKDYNIGICCFSAKYAALEERSNTGCLEIRIIHCVCPSGATCLHADCCFSELAP